MCVCVCVHMCVFICMCSYVCVHIYICVHIYVHVNIYMNICVYISSELYQKFIFGLFLAFSYSIKSQLVGQYVLEISHKDLQNRAEEYEKGSWKGNNTEKSTYVHKKMLC